MLASCDTVRRSYMFGRSLYISLCIFWAVRVHWEARLCWEVRTPWEHSTYTSATKASMPEQSTPKVTQSQQSLENLSTRCLVGCGGAYVDCDGHCLLEC